MFTAAVKPVDKVLFSCTGKLRMIHHLVTTLVEDKYRAIQSVREDGRTMNPEGVHC